MPFKVRISKFRHVYGSPYREQDCYKNISITRNAHDGSFCAVNSKFLAIVTETSGGGSFLVLLLSEVGRIDVDHPRIRGHRAPVVDLKFNPFNDHEIASCSDDGTVKVWSIPNDGLNTDIYQWKVDLHGHQRRVDYIEWHPTAENLILSAGSDHQVILWNVERAEPIQIYRCHPDVIQSVTWNRNGTLFATTCKDKQIRVIEARTGQIIAKGIGHPGPKVSKVVFLGDTNRLLSTGFGKQFERQVAVWNANDLSKALTTETIDFGAGALIPFYDHDTRTVYLAGKGDGNIRYYELTDQGEPYLYFLSEYKSTTPQRCLGVMPKTGLDVTRNEIMRFYKLFATGSMCEPISMIVTEAKQRKKRREIRKLEKVKKKAEPLLENADLDNKERNKQIKDLYRKYGVIGQKQVNVKYVVAKKSQRGGSRPAGAKGPYKVVDKRLKKDKRATKKQNKLNKTRQSTGKGRKQQKPSKNNKGNKQQKSSMNNKGKQRT
ncbi:unnamed protein product [Adineta steineri]|uniref:Coronin n=1 Tax=Adineta steineri TaxID=433720 RepID=A0A814GYW6_9BILA|nr:unnamed protein product [Adineta steineri]